MMETILKFVGVEALKALAFKLFMTYLLPKLFDLVIKGLRYAASKTATKIDDKAVQIQVDAKEKYLKIIEDEFK